MESLSNPKIVQQKINKHIRKTPLYQSTRKGKKYMIQNPEGKWVHFGSSDYEDFTFHKNKERQQSYLARASKIKGDWKNNMYSPNMLSIIALWDGFDYLKNEGII